MPQREIRKKSTLLYEFRKKAAKTAIPGPKRRRQKRKILNGGMNHGLDAETTEWIAQKWSFPSFG